MRLETRGLAEGYDRKQYEERLEYELGIIERMKYPGYFLIVADFIKWAKAHDIPVGPGRGSGAGSLVAYALTITDVDPLRFSLLFERFLNPDRVSMPDFDIDFCQDRREEVIRYVQQKYGRDQVGQIITFGTLQARAVLRDVGRVLQMPYGQVDRLCKMVPQNPANPVTLAKAIEGEPRFAEEAEKEPIVQTLLDMAQKLEGLYRHASTHAAGIVIGDRPLSELVPMYRDPRSDMPVTQFNMKYVEQAGLVKFDFLGLKTLTVLETAVKLIRRRGIDIDLAQIPLDDPDTYAMLSRGEVVGVFQVEIGGHAQGADRHEAGPHRGHHRAGGALPARARWRTSHLQCAQARRRGDRVDPPEDRPSGGGDAGRHRLPGTGDADRPGACRLFARRGRPAAPRHGQEDPRRDGQAARALRHRRGRARRGQAAGRLHLRPAGEVRRLRLQQEPRGGLRHRLLPDRLSEGALSGRVPRRVDDARHVEHRQAGRFPPGRDQARHRGRGALGDDEPQALRGGRKPHLLFARGAEGRRRRRRRAHRCQAQRAAVHGASPISASGSIRVSSASASSKA